MHIKEIGRWIQVTIIQRGILNFRHLPQIASLAILSVLLYHMFPLSSVFLTWRTDR